GVGMAAIPRRPTPDRMGGEAVNGVGGERSGGRDEQEDEKAVVGAAGFRDRDDRQPALAGLHRQAAGDKALDDRRQGVDDEAWQDAGEQAEGGEQGHRRQREAVGLPRRRRRRRSRATEERHAESLDEAGG